MIAAVVIVGTVGAVGTAGGTSGLAVDQHPVEYQALESEDHHVEVVFEESIDPSNYAFTVTDAGGTEVADDDDINSGLRYSHDRQVTLDLGDHDLSEGATLHVEGEGVDLALPITTTSAFVQEGYDHEPAIEPGETMALVDIWAADQYYRITDDDGTVMAEGTLGEHSFVAAVDTSDWEDGTSYSVKFGRESTFRAFSTVDLPEDDSDSLPPHVASRTGTWFTDFEPDRPGTTIKFDYGLTRGTIVIDETDSFGSTSATIDRWKTTPSSVPDPAPAEDVVSMLGVTVVGHSTSDEAPAMTVRLPVFMSSVDGEAEDLEVRYFDGDEWVSLETSVVDRSNFYGQEKVTVEATAPEPGPVAIVVADE